MKKQRIVWLVLCYTDYEGSRIQGVFSSRAKARAHKAMIYEKERSRYLRLGYAEEGLSFSAYMRGNFDQYKVEKHEVDKIGLRVTR